jgi:predicted RNase H-like nuclease (RuvC/YqgF family)
MSSLSRSPSAPESGFDSEKGNKRNSLREREQEALKNRVEVLEREKKALETRVSELEKKNEDLELTIAKVDSHNETLQMEVEELQDSLRSRDIRERDLIKERDIRERDLTSKIDAITKELLELKLKLPSQEDKESLEAGQIAFDFIEMAAVYVLGKNYADAVRSSLLSLKDVKRLSVKVDSENFNTEANSRWEKLTRNIRLVDDNFAIKQLKTDRRTVAHPGKTKTMTEEEITRLIKSRVNEQFAKAFLEDLLFLRTLPVS